MVREPPSVLLFSPVYTRHLLPTLNTKCLLSPSSVLSPQRLHRGKAPSRHPNTTIHMGANLMFLNREEHRVRGEGGGLV